MNELIAAMKKMPGFLKTETVGLEIIAEAQKKLDVEFSSEFIKYLQEIGEFTATGIEFTGIFFSKSWNRIVESVVDETMSERALAKEYGYLIPNDFYLIHNLGVDGILIWQNSKGEIYQTVRGASLSSPPKKIYGSLLEYFNNEILFL